MGAVEATRAVARAGAAATGDMAADAARLRALHGSEYTVEDARRLREIVQHGPAALTAGLARRRIDGAELDSMIGNIVEPSPYLMASTDVGAELDRFLAA